MNKKYRMLFSNSLVFAIGSFGSKLLLFFLVPLCTNALGVEEYGDADLIISVGDMLLPIISLTIYDAMLPYGLRKDIKKENVFLCVNAIYFLGSIGLLVLMPLFDFYLPIAQWKWYLYAYIVCSFASMNTMLYLKVKEKNKIYALLAIVQAFVLLGLNVWLLCFRKAGIEGYLLSMIVSRLVTAVLAFFLGKAAIDLKTAKFDKELLKAMLKYSIPLIANAISWWVINSSDRLMIEHLGNGTQLGLYTAAAKIPSFLSIFTSIFSQAWLISSIKEYGTSDGKEFYTKVFKYYSIFVFCMGIGINTFIKPIMSVYVGKDFAEAWKIVPLLLISAMLSAFSAFLGSMYGAFRKSKNVMYTTICGGVINVIINFLLIPKLGGIGAAIGTLVSYAVVVAFRMVDVNKETGINYSLSRFIPIFCLALLHGIAISCDFISIPVSVVVILIVAFLARREIKEILNIGKKIVKSKRK